MVEWLPLFCVLVFALFRLTLRSSSRFTVLRFCFTVLYFCFLLTVGAGVPCSMFSFSRGCQVYFGLVLTGFVLGKSVVVVGFVCCFVLNLY